MKAATLEFLKQRFSAYYQSGNLLAPPSMEEREWGFIFFDPEYPEIRMRRHMGFPRKDELFTYLRTMAPAHAYYSSAYYAIPDAPTMDQKQWLGADLIFDLDADHIVRGPYDMMLARVKEETEKLLEMLIGELGVAPHTIDLVFSGGRGYHVHVRDVETRNWGSNERRELIDYVCGIGLDPVMVLGRETHSPRGWYMRFIASLQEYLLWLREMEAEARIKEVSALEGVGKVSAEELEGRIDEILKGLSGHPPVLNVRDPLVARLVKGLTRTKEGKFASLLREKAALADEPVTTDIKRLIRLPSSLHGGSGFRVTPVPVREISRFDPLVDAVVFSDRKVNVDLTMKLSMSLLGSRYDLEKGINQVPEALAVFLCCRGVAEIGGG
ncbi:DNA primase small subunit [Methanolinea mesophila]|uniref:DNA primase catalytic subunit PriS n=1 Tax=Methanolinea mesophila TaxID=547055 RepID=UPI001AE1CC88|nr:DNA primase catalytic subunit PriS [Methanolinea mesophila]MBP1928245.1 DNA primase small subunit [Methanolinea mesophila]